MISTYTIVKEERADLLWILKRRSTVVFLTIVAAMAGIYFATKVPISVFPDTNFPRVVIGIDNGVMPVEQMQVTITKPVEDAVNSVPGLETVRSTTSRGTAEVSLFFNWNVDMYQTLQLVDAALSRVRQQLPATATITTHRLTFATFPILGYSLTSDTVPLSQLWEIATYDLKPPINRLPGVSDVGVQGDQIPDFEIVPDVGRMQNTGVTITDIQNAVQNTNTVDSPGLFRNHQQLVLGLAGGQVHDLDELGKITVKNTAAGVPVTINDVASVRPAIQPVYTMIRAEGREAVLLNITRQPTSNTVQVADEVAAEIERIKPSLPPGVTIKPYYDQSHLVRQSINSVRDAILIGLVLATIIIIVFLRDWRSSLVAGLVIPVTVSITFILLYVMGESFNLMTLGGLAAAVGLVIDDAIVVVENIVLHRSAGESRPEAIRKALGEIAIPLIGSTITPIVVFLPLIWVSGVTGSFFRALAVTMTASLLASLLLAVTWTPALSYLLLKEQNATDAHTHADSPMMERVLGFYERWLRRGLARPYVLLAICGVLLVGTFAGYRTLGSDLLPEMDEGGFVLDYIMPAGTSLQETDRVLTHVEEILKKTPEVDTISRRTGAQMGLAAVTEANTGDITVKLKDDRKRGIDEVIADLRAEINKDYPQLDVEFTQVLQDMIGDLSNAPEPIQIKLFNNNPEILSDVADRVATTIKKQNGVVDVQNGIDNTISGPSITFQVNQGIASRLGFSVPDVTTDAAAVVEGQELTTPLIQNGRSYGIRIRYPESSRSSEDIVTSALLVGSGGHLATLGTLATLKQNPGEQEILRENLQRDVVVTGRLEGADLGSSVTKVQQNIAGLHLPPTIRVQYGGTYAEQQKSFAELTRVLLIALLLVFGVLLAEFGNFSAPIAILTSSVLSVAGVVFALLITHTTFNVASFMGLIMVIGIVAKNGILLLDAEQRNAASYGTLLNSVVHAGRRRLRPILMTALAAVTGMLPLALAIGAGSQMLQPLAIAVIGGLVISLGLSLVVTPAVFYVLNKPRF
ncbi:MAG TPA: efflux RND transporter permease subunit [Acidobacteriaceae bacterium]|nr:efflux RND transporter permease subunit [Acidobacteriaceae bacterium]